MGFNILSLSGGGFLGLYTATVLARIEQDLDRPIASCFDLLAGTSIGGIIALGLAAGRSAKEIEEAFESNGTRIFSDRAAPTTNMGRLLDHSRSLFSPKYDGVALRETIAEIVGEGTLIGDLKHPVIVPTVNLTKGSPQVFKTAHHKSFQRDHRLKVADVALATSAAPLYFPVAEIGDEMFVDGGLYANSPDLMALHEAEYFFKVPAEDVSILSIGTTTANFSLSHRTGTQLGALDWAGRLPQTVISAQQMDVEYMLRHKLGDRYLRIDMVQSKEQERDLGLDVATDDAQRTIRAMASASHQAVVNNDTLKAILSHQPEKPHFYYQKTSEGAQEGPQ